MQPQRINMGYMKVLCLVGNAHLNVFGHCEILVHSKDNQICAWNNCLVNVESQSIVYVRDDCLVNVAEDPEVFAHGRCVVRVKDGSGKVYLEGEAVAIAYPVTDATENGRYEIFTDLLAVKKLSHRATFIDQRSFFKRGRRKKRTTQD